MKLLLSGSERTMIIKKNILGSFVIKGFGMLTTFILVPFTINLIDKQKYGIWITIFSIVTWFSMMDIGLGNGFRNKFAEAIALKNNNLANIYLQTLYSSMFIIAGALLLAYLSISPFINWHNIINIPLNFDEDINLIFGVVFVLFCFQLVFKNISTVLLSMQKTAFSNSLILFGNALSLLLIYTFSRFYATDLLSIALIFMISPIIIFSVATAVVFKNFLPNNIHLSFSWPKKIYLNELMNLGIKFFIIQITAIVMFSSSSIIISRLYGPAEVTPYSVTYQLFASVQFLFSIIVTPFWTAYTEANAKNDYIWIKKSINKLMIVWIFFSFGIFILWAISPLVFKFWLGDKVLIPYSLSFQFALFAILMTWISIFSYYVSGIGKITILLYGAIFQLIFYIPLAIFLAKILNIGTIGIILATNLNLLVPALLLYFQTKKILNGRAYGIWNT